MAFPRLAAGLLVGVVMGAAAYLIWSTQGLPASVVSRFGTAGAAGHAMPRGAYLGVMLGLAAGVPLLVAVAIGALAAGAGRAPLVPDRNYWFAQERRAASAASMARFGCGLGILIALFVVAVHAMIVAAHDTVPPRLSAVVLFELVLCWAAALTGWLIALRLRFARPPR
jgi:hypothetical protein